jgi:endonuclease IV
MPILGAHQSIAGGYYLAIERAAEVGCDCVQLFTNGYGIHELQLAMAIHELQCLAVACRWKGG